MDIISNLPIFSNNNIDKTKIRQATAVLSALKARLDACSLDVYSVVSCLDDLGNDLYQIGYDLDYYSDLKARLYYLSGCLDLTWACDRDDWETCPPYFDYDSHLSDYIEINGREWTAEECDQIIAKELIGWYYWNADQLISFITNYDYDWDRVQGLNTYEILNW